MLKYKSYKFDDKGIKKGFSRKYQLLWNDIVEVSTVVSSSGSVGPSYSVALMLLEKNLTIEYRKYFSAISTLHKFIEVVKFILAKVPEDIVNDKTTFIAKWASKINQIADDEKALIKQPNDLVSLTTLANFYWIKLDLNKAKKLFKKALKISPYSPEILQSIALVDLDLGKNIKKIIEQYKYILTLAPTNTRYLLAIAKFHLINDEKEGLEYAERLLKIDPENIQIRLFLGIYYRCKEDYPQAIKLYKDVAGMLTNHLLKNSIQELIIYLDRLENDPEFRKKEKLKTKINVTWNWIVLIFFILIFLIPIIIKILGAFS